MDRRTYFDGSRWRAEIGKDEYCGPTVDRLAAYENTGLEPEEITALISPPNPPLTLEELREMYGKPVWIERNDSGVSGWAIIGDMKSLYGVYFGTARGGLRLHYDEIGKTWLAYRRKPEEGTT